MGMKKKFVLTGALGTAGIVGFAVAKPVIGSVLLPVAGAAAVAIGTPLAVGAILGLAAYGLVADDKETESKSNESNTRV